MGKLAERERKARTGVRRKCAVLRALEGLDQADGDAVLRLVFTRRDLTADEVVEILKPEVVLSHQIVAHHRAGNCVACRKG